MPIYSVRAKQGGTTRSYQMEGKSQDSIVQFFDQVTTQKVTKIFGGALTYVYSGVIPIDDMNYFSRVTVFVSNSTTRLSKAVHLNNVKKTINETTLGAACIAHLEIDGLAIDSTVCIFT